MSELKTNKIQTNDQNNVAIDNALQIKGYTTAERDALSSPQAGDVIYNEDDGTIDFYNGTSWNATSGSTFSFSVDYLVVAGGGGGGTPSNPGGENFGAAGGGGAGGLRSSVTTSGGGNSAESAISGVTTGTNYTVTVGAGGPASSNGNNSVFSTVTSIAVSYTHLRAHET